MLSFSCKLADLGASANSLHSATSFHFDLRSSIFIIGDCFGVPGRKSQSCRPSSSCTGDSPVSWSGVLRSCRRPCTRLAVSMSPVGLTASRRRRFAAATDLSAFWLEPNWGYSESDSQLFQEVICYVHIWCERFWNSEAVKELTKKWNEVAGAPLSPVDH